MSATESHQIEAVLPEGATVPRRVTIIDGVDTMLDSEGRWSYVALDAVFRRTDLRTKGSELHWPTMVIVEPDYTTQEIRDLPNYFRAWHYFVEEKFFDGIELHLMHVHDPFDLDHSAQVDIINRGGGEKMFVYIFGREFFELMSRMDHEPWRQLLTYANLDFGFSTDWSKFRDGTIKTIEARFDDGDVFNTLHPLYGDAEFYYTICMVERDPNEATFTARSFRVGKAPNVLSTTAT